MTTFASTHQVQNPETQAQNLYNEKNEKLTGQQYDDNLEHLYLLDTNGDRQTGWQRVCEDWYYFDPKTGIMQTGIQIIDGKIYFLGGTGDMRTAWQIVNGKQHYFNRTGEMLFNCITPDGYTVDANGCYIEPKSKFPEGTDLTSIDARELTIDEMRQTLLARINEERAKNGLQPLVTHRRINEVAQLRANEITVLFGHTRPNGLAQHTAHDELRAGNGMIAENLARGYDNIDDVMDGWMQSEGHKKNILTPEFTTVGLACTTDAYGRLCWVQEFCEGKYLD